MDRDVWFMVAWMVGKHGADAPKVVEEMVDRLRREHGRHPGTVEEHDIVSWVAIYNAVIDWLGRTESEAELVH
jgi:hypothetical protein